MASDSQLLDRVWEILRSSDPNIITVSTLVRTLEQDLDIDLQDRKRFIRQQVDLFLLNPLKNPLKQYSHIQQCVQEVEDDEEDEEDDDDEEEEEDDDNDEDEEEDSDAQDKDFDEAAEKLEVKEEINENRIKTESTSSVEKVDNNVKKRGRGFNKPCGLSPELKKIVGAQEMVRTEVVKRVWAYIKEKNLQNPSDKRKILCDELLHGIFHVNSVDMFQMNKFLCKHMWPIADDGEPKKNEKRSKGEGFGFVSQHLDFDFPIHVKTAANEADGDVYGEGESVGFVKPFPLNDSNTSDADCHVKTGTNQADSVDGYESEVSGDPVGGDHDEELVDDEFVLYEGENVEDAPGIRGPSSKPGMGQWEGHIVHESYVDIFCNIRREHPETFRNFKYRSEAACTSALNTLGEFYVSFASKPVAAMGVDDIAHFRDMFADLEVFKFDVGWLQKRIDHIEELRFRSPLAGELVELKKRKETRDRDVAELKKELAKQEKELAELKVFCASKAEEVRATHGYLGENVNTCKAADGLLGGWPERDYVL